MVAFGFRPSRIKRNMAMSVGLQDIHTKQSFPGLATTTVINFSPEGACLVLSKLIFEGKHLFYATLDSDRYNLLLHPDEGEQVANSLAIAAKSIWMDSCDHESEPAFKIGIRFLQKQNKLFNILKSS